MKYLVRIFVNEKGQDLVECAVIAAAVCFALIAITDQLFVAVVNLCKTIVQSALSLGGL